MLTLGLAGGFTPRLDEIFGIGHGMFHNSAAAIIDDGKVVAAIEEERLNRIKNTTQFPLSAARFCLNSCGARLEDIDAIAWYFKPDVLNGFCQNYYSPFSAQEELKDAKYYILSGLKQVFGEEVDIKKLHFVPHHYAHAESAYAMSGFENSLVFVADFMGEMSSGLVQSRDGDKVQDLFKLSMDSSLGEYYLTVIGHLGYSYSDEYKVMGLAPYGDPARYRSMFSKFYTLEPKGNFFIRKEIIKPFLYMALKPRMRGEPFTQAHKDLAAALQESLQKMIFHVLEYYQGVTGHEYLCLAGGVAHNCSVNGKVLYSGLFKDIFVQPAAHDAGCALGAALYTGSRGDRLKSTVQLESVYWGSDIGENSEILETLKKWKSFIHFDKKDDIAKYTAGLLADGAVIGWVQGRSEFGPRALGNRSIIADPRPAENKDIINAMVKKREAYRPFAPSVLEEYVDNYFELPTARRKYPFMNFVLNVLKDKQKLLGATTHVDGTARIQTVSRDANPRYWELINEFRKITGVPVLLNTSFNNNAEPIVDSVEDAVVCFLTTKLNYLVIGDFIIEKKMQDTAAYMQLVPSMPRHVSLRYTKRHTSENGIDNIYDMVINANVQYFVKISEEIFRLFSTMDGNKTLNELFDSACIDFEKRESLIDEVLMVWSARAVTLMPVKTTG